MGVVGSCILRRHSRRSVARSDSHYTIPATGQAPTLGESNAPEKWRAHANGHGIAQRAAVATRQDQHENDSCCDDSEDEESSEYQSKDRSV